MDSAHKLQYLLGGNTADGFYSLYNSFPPADGCCFLWIIKGGPGCGKSSFMKMIGAAAERAGYDVEYVICSGDPGSLDGVYIPRLKVAYMDGTAPHVRDAALAAADSAYIDLGAYYDRRAIASYREELGVLNAEISLIYKRAYSLLAAAGSINRGWKFTFAGKDEKALAIKRVMSIEKREFGRPSKTPGRVLRRFLTANTCHGLISMPETAKTLCSRFYILEDSICLSGQVLEHLSAAAVSSGYDVIAVPDPLTPELPEAILVPDLSLGIIAGSSKLAQDISGRKIRLDALIPQQRLKEIKAEVKRCSKLCDTLIEQAAAMLARAKELHDSIEKIYNPNVDFDGVYATVAKHLLELGLK